MKYVLGTLRALLGVLLGLGVAAIFGLFMYWILEEDMAWLAMLVNFSFFCTYWYIDGNNLWPTDDTEDKT